MAQQDDACTLLDEDHNQVARLLEQYKAAHDKPRKQVLAQQIFHELAVHMALEEEIFYPAFIRATREGEQVQDAEREHRDLRELMAKYEHSHGHDKVMLEIEDAVLHHVNDEREKMFPEARKAQGLDLARLARQMLERKAELQAEQAA
ncbi:MAG TPA: hemerythrin domain-containing protein [Ramlibacter sp.]|nr:hemerythrin domain-containing protein [Ramlibacter sp.]